MSKRLAMLEQMVQKGAADSFAYYALALEYSGLARVDEAVGTFTTLREKDPGYVPMYLMCGTMLAKAGRVSDAREWLTEGETVARAKGDDHALGEIQGALASLPG